MPPAPEFPEPTDTVIAPPRPTVEIPEPIAIVPESLDEVVPEEKVRRPDAPPVPALAVRTRIEPEEDAVPSPDSIVRRPPVASSERPAMVLIEPPTPVAPEPTVKEIEPPVPEPADAPDPMRRAPELPDVAAPEEN